jgi:membrane protease YdiL (CAAX protease family)
VIITVVTVVLFLASSGIPSGPIQELTIVIPVAIIIATLNAFIEEFTLRAAPLSVLWERIGKEQALLLTTVYFALGHFYGYPSGVIGILLAGFLGYFLGKSLLETRGFFWSWLIHFLPDGHLHIHTHDYLEYSCHHEIKQKFAGVVSQYLLHLYYDEIHFPITDSIPLAFGYVLVFQL